MNQLLKTKNNLEDQNFLLKFSLSDYKVQVQIIHHQYLNPGIKDFQVNPGLISQTIQRLSLKAFDLYLDLYLVYMGDYSME